MSEKAIVGDIITVTGKVTVVCSDGGLSISVEPTDAAKAVVVKKVLRPGDVVVCKYPGNEYDKRIAKVQQGINCECVHLDGKVRVIGIIPQYWHIATAEDIAFDEKERAEYKKKNQDAEFTKMIEGMSSEDICEKVKQMANILVKKADEKNNAEKKKEGECEKPAESK